MWFVARGGKGIIGMPWLLLLNTVFVRFYYIVRIDCSFCTIFHYWDVPQFTHSPTENQPGCFQVWVVVNKSAVDICVQVLVWTCFQLLLVNNKKCNCWIVW